MNAPLLEMLLGEMSVSGEEFALQEKLKEHMAPFCDTIVTDAIGDGMYTLRGEKDKTVLMAAHIDEIGLMVSGATSDGFLRVVKTGGIQARTYPGHTVQVHTENGVIYGSVVNDPKAVKGDDFSYKNLRIDIGAKSKEEALKAVAVGDRIVFDTHYRKLLNNRIVARGLDDRSGVYCIMEALKGIKDVNNRPNVCAAATVGEETTMHGARWVAEQVLPTEALIVDVTYVSDYDGMREAEFGEVELGKGPVICVGPMCSKAMGKKLMALAEKHNIPYQVEVTTGRTCTDGDQIHFAGKGIPVELISIPLRYMHTPGEVADQNDLNNTIRLLKAYIEEIK